MTVRVGHAAAQLGGWAVVGVISALVAALLWGRRDPLAHAFDLAQHLAPGVLSAGAVLLWQRAARRVPAWGAIAAVVAVAGVAAWLLVVDDFAEAAARVAGERALRDEGGATWRVALQTAAVALAVPVVLVAARRLVRHGWRLPVLAAAIAVAAANARLFPQGYQGLHLFLGWTAALAAAAALEGAAHPGLLARRAGIALAASALLAGLALAVPPPNLVRLELLRRPGSVVAPYAALLHPFRDAPGRPVEGPDAAWFASRDSAPPVAPTPGATLGPDAVVVLLAIDSLRADVLDDPRTAGRFPHLERLRAESVRFTRARATGSQTVYTVTSLFAGSHFSQQLWTRRHDKKSAQRWPHEDPAVRFPALLAAAGVPSFTAAPYWWMSAKTGVVGGIDDSVLVRRDEGGARSPRARELVRPVLERLGAHREGRLFVYVHFVDPHGPYESGDDDAPAFERYLAEVSAVDAALGLVRAALEAGGQWERSALIVYSDHGEAFGEHGTWEHATTLYEELLRVPILVRAPGAAPRDVDEPVSTIDLGPTILDLFGVATPGRYMGQSLMPLVRGADPRLDRPIVAEGRLQQALVTRAGVKAIRDLHNGTLEVYDLARDPDELVNLIGTGDAAAEDALNRLRRFFDVHTRREGGYHPPMRR